MNKKAVFISIAGLLAFVSCFSLAKPLQASFTAVDANGSYTLKLDSNQRYVSGETFYVRTTSGSLLNFQTYLASSSKESFITLDAQGTIQNNDPINSITSVSVEYSGGAPLFSYGFEVGEEVLYNANDTVLLETGVSHDLTTARPAYFKIQNTGEEDLVISSITLTYACAVNPTHNLHNEATVTVKDVNGPVLGATLTMLDGSTVLGSAVTDENGIGVVASLAGTYVSGQYTVKVETAQHIAQNLTLTGQTASTSVELTRTPGQAAYIWRGNDTDPVASNFSSYHTWFWRTSEFICTDILFEQGLVKGTGAREASLWLHFGDTAPATRLGSKVLEIRFSSDGWFGAIQYTTNVYGDFVDFGSVLANNLFLDFEKDVNNVITKVYIKLRPATVNTIFGAGTFNVTDTYGWTTSQWNGDNVGSEFFGISSWTTNPGDPTFCDPAVPNTYMRVNSYNQFVTQYYRG